MKRFLFFLIAALVVLSVVACANGNPDETDVPSDSVINGSDDSTDENQKELDDPVKLDNCKTVRLDPTKTHQTIESFGASGAWWSQDVGGWDEVRKSDGLEIREYIAQLLFDDELGIGLNSYRYNIGAGSGDVGSKSTSGISDKWRRAQSFINPKTGEYDWDRDKNAVWFMRKAAELGVDELIMFCNSPHESLTINGKSFTDPSRDGQSNIDKENYEAFAKYTLDVVEHFVEEGLPIKFVSPINEPQWGWTGGQEGCHYSTSETIKVLSTFVKALEEREALVKAGVEISGPENVSWNADHGVIEMSNAIMQNKVLKNHLSALDCHSYWSDAAAKKNFAASFVKKNPDVKLRCSEWCEMVNGKDTTVDSAVNLAIQMHEDLTILDCVSWQYWIAVSCYDYRDGLIYVDLNSHKVTVPKRFYAMGNYSKFIDPGYVRIDASLKTSDFYTSAYKGVNENGEDEIVMVFVNNKSEAVNIDFSGIDASAYNRMGVYMTNKGYSLAERFYGKFTAESCVEIPSRSIVTVVVSNVAE